MKYKLTFRVPNRATKVVRHWDGEQFSYVQNGSAPAQAMIKINAISSQQAFVIGHSIAKRNGWALSSQPAKVSY